MTRQKFVILLKEEKLEISLNAMNLFIKKLCE